MRGKDYEKGAIQKRLIFFILSIAVMLTLSACAGNTPNSDSSTDKESTAIENSIESSEVPATKPTISIQIGDRTFHATLYANPSVEALVKKLPLTLEMQELNGNEKYVYFSEDWPSASARVDKIQAGDLMLYGSDCLVLFYESFSTSYSYTRLGRIEEPAGLAEALGKGRVSVTLKIEK